MKEVIFNTTGPRLKLTLWPSKFKFSVVDRNWDWQKESLLIEEITVDLSYLYTNASHIHEMKRRFKTEKKLKTEQYIKSNNPSERIGIFLFSSVKCYTLHIFFFIPHIF